MFWFSSIFQTYSNNTTIKSSASDIDKGNRFLAANNC